MTKRWKDPTDYLNTKLFQCLTDRTSDGTPIIHAYHETIPSICLPAHIQAGSKLHPQPQRNGFAHFYLDDYQFERFWNFPIRYIAYLHSFSGALSPDFSVYSDYPEPLQRYNIFRNRALGAYWQYHNIPVIPSVSWSTLETLKFCFTGIEPGGVVSISTVGILREKTTKDNLIYGYSDMIHVLHPSHVLIYGLYPEELEDYGVPITRIPAYYEKFEANTRKIVLE